MAREVLQRIVVNDRPTVFRLAAADIYRPERNKKRLAGRVDPTQVAVTRFHYLFAKYGPVVVAKNHLGVDLRITTIEDLEANPQWLENNAHFRSARVKPQTLKTKGGYVGSNIVLLVNKDGPIFMGAAADYMTDFMGAFFYVHDHFPGATEANLRDPNMWAMWLGMFTVGFAKTGPTLVFEMRDHIQSLDKTMASWYPRR
jgi:hypothetical protein